MTPVDVEALNRQGRHEEAAAAMEAVARVACMDLHVWLSLAQVQLDAGNVARARDAFARAAELMEGTEDPAQRRHRGAVLLLLGRTEEGFADLARAAERLSDAPHWRGEPFEGRTLLVFGDGGFGDDLLYARFVPLAVQRGGTVVVQTRAGLEPLLRTLPGVAFAVSRPGALPSRDDLPPHDLQVWMAAIPGLLGVAASSGAPYLRAPRPRYQLPPSRGLKVGLVWSGNTKRRAHNGEVRWIPFDALAPLLAVPGVTFTSLQAGEPGARAEGLMVRPPLETWMDTAAVMAQLDLVIAVDGGPANLAGALGVPTWLLVRSGFWGWGLEGDRCPWYDSVRLFRQRRGGDWGDVIRRVADELRALVESRAAKAA